MTSASTLGWPIGGGEMGDRIRSFDWGTTSLGPIAGWSDHLRFEVNTMVNSPIPKVLMWGPDHVMVYNDGYIAIAGKNHPDAFGSTVAQVWPEIWDFNRRTLEEGLAGTVQSFRDQPMVLLRNGEREEVMFDLFYTPIHVEDGSIGGLLGTILEITDRVRVREALERSSKRFQAAVDAVSGVLWTTSPEGRMVGEQVGWGALTGQSMEQYADEGWSNAVHPEDRERTIAVWNESVASRTPFLCEHRVRRHDGHWRHFAVRAIPALDHGEVVEWVGIHTDITEQREAERELKEHAALLERQVVHRKRAEDQLRQLNETLESRIVEALDERRQAQVALAQAQKLETVGKLTGGIAHDFNNLLQVVSGNLQLLSRDVLGNERAERRIVNAMAGVQRGSKLAAQLLAFGRRQALEPKVVNATRFVRNMDDMLRRAIGEGIEIETIVGGGLWNTFIDPTQIENALLNLAINARDAMEGSGRLTIELGNASLDDDYVRHHTDATPGQYVMLAVSDTGSGMPPEVIDKVFEPFFSTKPEGKGSGLGLSMVYGFVKQSGGHVKIYSEIGHGTTIKLYLPRAFAAEDVETVIDAGPLTGGSETILVVEDDEDVRATVVEMLTDLGYRVLKAVDAQSGLSVVESGIPIDLLFTDVVMPGTLKSPELARRAKERLPKLAVLFTSGYTENSIVHGGRLDAGVELLSKPYTREALARKVRHVLANEAQRAQPSSGVPSANEASAEAQAEKRSFEPKTVLLVEDDALIRMNTADMLHDAGHVVVEAGSAEDALLALEAAPVDVLVTDVNLPGLSGRQLAERARKMRPEIGIVFATGDMAVEGIEDAERLAKPYTMEELDAAVGRFKRGKARHSR